MRRRVVERRREREASHGVARVPVLRARDHGFAEEVRGGHSAVDDRAQRVLRAIARERDARFGVYGSAVEPGRVAVGDPVEIEP